MKTISYMEIYCKNVNKKTETLVITKKINKEKKGILVHKYEHICRPQPAQTYTNC